MLQQLGDIVVRTPAQELAPNLTGEWQPVTDVIATMDAAAPWMILPWLNGHALPTSDVYLPDAADLSKVVR